ncbi:hypothetical protein ACA910_004104 [Epithemia clementina (nom. ined.)]
MIQTWTRSCDKNNIPQEKDFPVDCVYSLWMADILRFLWITKHQNQHIAPIFLEALHDHKQAVDCFHNTLRAAFPDHAPTSIFNNHPAKLGPSASNTGSTPLPQMPKNPNPFVTGPVPRSTAAIGSQGANPTFSGVSPDMLFLTNKVSEEITNQSLMLKAHEDRKDHFKTLPIHT